MRRSRSGIGLLCICATLVLVLVMHGAADSLTGQSSRLAATGLLVGNSAVQAGKDYDAPGLAEALRYTATTSGTVGYISLYVDSGNAARSVVVGLYTNRSGSPGTLLTRGTITAPQAAAWNTVAVSGAHVSAGKRYWLALVGLGGQVAFRDRASGGRATQSSTQTTLTDLPSKWSSGARWANSPASFYATANATATPTPTASATSRSVPAPAPAATTSPLTATSAASATPTPTPSTTSASTSTSAPSGMAAPSPTTVPSLPPSSGFPNQTNTGYENAPGYPGSLTDCSNVTIQSNTTYKFCNFPAGLRVGNPGAVLTNVAFVGCRFADNSVNDANVATYSDNVSFQYDTFEPNTVPMGSEPISPYAAAVANTNGNEYGIDQRQPGTLTIDHSDFWGFADGIQFGYSSQAKPVTISNSWFHNPRNPGGAADHTDGILNSWGGISYVTINNNSIVGDGNTQAVALQGSDSYDHVWITNNYLSGYGYMVSIGGHAKDTNITFARNVWSSEFEPGWGPLYNDVNFVTTGLGNVSSASP